MSSSGATGNKVFAPAIFFIAFREALEASLVIGILSGMLERVVDVRPQNGAGPDLQGRALIKKLRRYIFLGAGTGLIIAFAIGAAFLAVFYTQTTDLYGRSEELWEGIFNLIAVCLITPMSLAILHADRSRAKWRKKLNKAFAGVQSGRKELQIAVTTVESRSSLHRESDTGDATLTATQESDEARRMSRTEDAITPVDGEDHIQSCFPRESQEKTRDTEASHQTIQSRRSVLEQSPAASAPKGRLATLIDVVRRPFAGEAKGATAIFLIPLVTTLREGLEGVVFIGGVSLGLPATSIPLPAVLGLFAGLLCGFIVFKLGSFSKVRFFLVISTCFLLIIAAGMASRAVYYFQFYRYIQLVGDAAAESGSGPGSYNALNYVWHIDCCNPEDKSNGGSGWSILNSIFGWNNTATVGSLLAYIFYWLTVAGYLVFSHFRELQKVKKARERRFARQHQGNGAINGSTKDLSDSRLSTPVTEKKQEDREQASQQALSA